MKNVKGIMLLGIGAFLIGFLTVSAFVNTFTLEYTIAGGNTTTSNKMTVDQDYQQFITSFSKVSDNSFYGYVKKKGLLGIYSTKYTIYTLKPSTSIIQTSAKQNLGSGTFKYSFENLGSGTIAGKTKVETYNS